MSRYSLAAIGIAFLALVVIIPLGAIFQYASGNGLGAFGESLSSPEALFSLRFAIMLALATTAINGVLGTVVAFMPPRHDFPLRGLINWLLDLPLAIPASVIGFTLLFLYGPLGILGEAFEGARITTAAIFPGILIIHVFMTLPLVARAVGPVLADADRSELEAAKVLGANEVQVFTRIVLPAIKGGLLSGCVFTFARSLGEIGVTIIVSGGLALKTQTTALFIFSGFNQSNVAAAKSVAVLLVIISLVSFFGFKLANKFMEVRGTSNGKRNIHQESY